MPVPTLSDMLSDLEKHLEGLLLAQQPDQVGVLLEVDLGKKAELNELPDEAEDQVRPPLHQVGGADVDDS